ncbi:MAG: response regulator transcription factor [Clostridium sp.]|nr:response regulator transcription factor [Clostridium sp.]MDY5895234.1 response regulator transcription factor [Oscillospiraceae bacterium]
MRILIAEDERSLNRVIKKQLTAAGYSVDYCFDGGEAYDCLSMTEYDLAVLDVMMPVLDGFELVRRLRAVGNSTPVIFLTARDDIEDRVCGLDIGADDYLVKPFAFDELLARIRVVLRKHSGGRTSVLTVGDLEVDTAARKVRRAGREINLSAKEYELLHYLLLNKGIVLSREKIENHIWNYDYEGGTNVVDVYIRYLRKKLDDGFDKKLIHTVRGMGYVLREE